jgi:hypothetical protein
MYIGLDKLANQGIKKVIVAVPERTIGASFKTTDLKSAGFFADWRVAPSNNLTIAGGGQKTKAVEAFLRDRHDSILICTHATLRFAYENLGAGAFSNCLVAIDEFHHGSADAGSKLGELARGLMADGGAHIVAMTGSYFRGDTVPVLRPEDEARFRRVTYTYYEQLAGYQHLKTLGIGYHFYSGKYLEAIGEVLDANKKTIVHIPSVMSAAAEGEKTRQVDTIIEHLAGGDASRVRLDITTGFHLVTREDGRILKVADLVDDSPEREQVLESLRNVKHRNDLDIIIALGMAKEGFDWIWCEHVLTIGYRNSMTEVVQIIGRATRDAEGKTHAQFTNLVAKPENERAEVVDAVNNMLKAISVALIMEQVLAPTFNFRTRLPDDVASEGTGLAEAIQGAPILVRGLQEPSTDRVREIRDDQLDELKIALYADPFIQTAMIHPDAFMAGEITTVLIPRVIERQFPDLSPQEVNEVRHAVLLDLNLKNAASLGDGGQIPVGSGEPHEGENALIKLGKKFVDLADLSIDLIDSVNPFEHAYEILAKNLSEPILRAIHSVVVAGQLPMEDHEAVALWAHIQAFRAQYSREPNVGAQDPREQRLARALAIIRAAKRAATRVTSA